MKLAVPHFKQSHPLACLPVCAQMVLAFLGKSHTEKELIHYFQTHPKRGTRPDNAVTGLEKLGYHVLWFQNGTLSKISDLLNENWPVIVFVQAIDLPHGHGGLHALVIIGIENDQVICLDPILDKELQLPLSSFITIWSNLGNLGMVIWL